MFSILGLELKRAFLNKFFVISVLAGCTISVLQIIDYPFNFAFDIGLSDNTYPISVFNTYIGLSMMSVWTFVFYMIFPLLACLPFADSFLTDKKSGYTKQIFTRTSKGKYLSAKLISVFLSGGTAVLIPLLLNLLLTALCVPSVIPDASVGTFPIFGNQFASDIYYSNPYAYILIYDLILFVTSGVFACTALAFSYFTKYKYIVLLIPFLLFMAISYLSNMISEHNQLNISEWILPMQNSQTLNILIAIIELFVIFGATCLIFFYKGLNDDTF